MPHAPGARRIVEDAGLRTGSFSSERVQFGSIAASFGAGAASKAKDERLYDPRSFEPRLFPFTSFSMNEAERRMYRQSVWIKVHKATHVAPLTHEEGRRQHTSVPVQDDAFKRRTPGSA